jgi:signal transduction histidine kinase
MRGRLFLAAIAISALLVFAWVVRQISFVSLGLAANREVQEVLRTSLDDQKKLAHADPSQSASYHRRFDEIRKLLGRLQILELTRENLTRHYELLLLAVMAAILITGGGLAIVERRVRDRRRMQYLQHLTSWQEAARRHAHEIRTPLTAASLEIGELVSKMKKRHPESEADLQAAEGSIREELDQLRRFTSGFASFAVIGEPQRKTHDIARFTEEFCTLFAPTWPQLRIVLEPSEGDCRAIADREMIRQVFVNLCSNSALAATELHIRARRSGGNVIVEFRDDGPGIPPEVRARLFEPYTTTRRIGEGMGLGLAISKKIMLDHDGDLVLLHGSRGAAFRLTLPAGADA